jgi:hypothetical protein
LRAKARLQGGKRSRRSFEPNDCCMMKCEQPLKSRLSESFIFQTAFMPLLRTKKSPAIAGLFVYRISSIDDYSSAPV